MSKQVLDVHQMQHLQELGLDTSNASAKYYRMSKKMDWFLVFGCRSKEELLGTEENIPAYTLQDVLDALPESIKHKDFRYYLVYNKSEGFIVYYRVDFDGNHRYARYEEIYNGIEGLSVIDAAYSLLCWAIENKFVETDKNE